MNVTHFLLACWCYLRMRIAINRAFAVCVFAIFLTSVGDIAQAQPTQVIIETNVDQTSAILDRLQRNDQVLGVRQVFGSGLLVVTTNGPESLDNQNFGVLHVNQVLDISSAGGRSPAESDIVSPPPFSSAISTSLARTALASPTSNDPLNTFQWSYQNFGYERGRYANAVAGVDTGAHAVAGDGAGVTVAIVTTGADYTHEDLAGALWTNDLEIPGNSMDDDNNGYVDDVYGPGPFGTGDTFDQYGDGTALTGIIAARKNNGVGIAGIASGARVLACNAAIAPGKISVADMLLCIDYVIYQKQVRHENIPIFVFTIRGFKPFDQIIEPALKALMDADIIVVAPIVVESPNSVGVNVDWSTDSPATADFPNIISVSAADRAGKNAFDSGGIRTVDVMAPGYEIVTTLPGFSAAQDSASFVFEDLESVPAGWALSGGWAHASLAGHGGSGALQLTSGVGTVFDAAQIIELPPIDLTSIPGPRPWFSFKLWAENMVNTHIPSTEGSVELEIKDLNSTWRSISSNYERMAGPAWQSIQGTLSDFQLSLVDLSDVRLRFRAALTDEHAPVIVVDDFGIGAQVPYPGYSNYYGFYNGTAPAAAIVAAMAAVIKAERPALANIEVRNLLAGSGRSIEDVSGQPRRFAVPPPPLPENRFPALWTSDGLGATQCSGVLTQRRTLPPFTNTTVRSLGQPFVIKSVSTDCHSPGQAPLVTAKGSNNTFSLLDDGDHPDVRAQDAEFSGKWQSDTPINETLAVTNDPEEMPVLALRDYGFTPVPFQWRDVEKLRDSERRPPFDPPFELLIGDLAANNGILASIDAGTRLEFDVVLAGAPMAIATIPGSPSTLDNIPSLNTDFGQFRVAPIFTASNMHGSYFGWPYPETQVNGSAPNREWVLEWLDFNYPSCADGSISVQMVLFENSPDILISYRDVPLDCDGKIPRLLVQYNIDSWTEYEQDLAPATSVVLTPRLDSNAAPSVTGAIPDQVIAHGQELSLDLAAFFADADGDNLEYFLGKDQEYVSVDQNGVLRAKFPAFPSTDIPVRSIQVGAHDGRLSTRTSFGVTFENSQNAAPVQKSPALHFPITTDGYASLDVSEFFEDPDIDALEFIDASDPDATDRIRRDGIIDIRKFSLNNIGDEVVFEFLVSDGMLAIQSSATITVVAGNLPPPIQLAAIPDQSVRVGEYLRVPLYKYFETLVSGNVDFAVTAPGLGSASYELAGIPKAFEGIFTEQDRVNSPYNIEVRATIASRSGVTVTNFALSILPENQAPDFSVAMPIQVSTGEQVNIDLRNIVSDAESDPLFFIVGDLPVGLQLATETRITGTLQSAGQFSTSLRVTDSFGASLITSLEITANAPPPPPPPQPPKKSGGGGGSTEFILLGMLLIFCRRKCLRRPCYF